MAWAPSAQARTWTRAGGEHGQVAETASIGAAGARIAGSSRSVRILRRLIPVLVVTFLTVLGIARVVSLISEHHRLETEARHRVASLVTAAAAIMARAEPDLNDMTLAQTTLGLLRAAFPAQSVLSGGTIVVSRNNGQVVASWPTSTQYDGRQLADVLGGNQPLTTLGARAGVLEVALEEGQSALAAVSHLGGVLGAVAVILPGDNVLAQWRADLRTEILLFVLTAAILMLMTYAYFNQTARAEQTSAVHDDVQSRTATAFRRGRCGLWDWDLTTGDMFWSASMLDMLGMPAGSGFITCDEAAARIEADDFSLETMLPRLRTGEASSVDTMLRIYPEGRAPLWFRLRADVVEHPDTGRLHLIGIASDITEQHLKAEADALADLRLRDAIETISEAFVLWDASNCLVLCNSNYRKLHNLADDDARPGTPYAELMARARQPVVRTPVPQDAHESDGSTTFEAQIEDGRWLQINERRTKDGGFVSVGTDITQLKRHEERLVESEKRLLGTVMDLRQSRQKLELQAQQLVELAEKYSEEKGRAEEANRIKSDFLANISHELRTPLNAIIGFSEIMSNGAIGPMGAEKYVEYGRDIHASGQFLLNVINDILDMSRIEAGRMELAPEAIDLKEIATEALHAIELQAQEKSIAVASEFDDTLVVAADRRAMRQVMMNLLSNAVKFTAAGGRVTLKGRALPDGVSLSFEDTGIGIPADAIRRLGQPFVQVANQFTKTHKGSGLGLAIARSLVELHGGTMKIWSTEGVGTIISIRLPYHRPVTAEDAESAA